MITIGSFYFSQFVSSAVQQIVSTSTNLKGVAIKTCTASFNSSASLQQVVLFADTTAPSGAGDSTKKVIASFLQTPNAAGNYTLPYALFIPAGLGLWVATTGNAGIIMTYDVLPPQGG